MSEPAAFDPNAPTNELIAFALAHPDNEEWDNPHWEAIRALRARGTREVFDAATRLLESENAAARELGADIHAQLGGVEQPFGAESVVLLNRLLATEQNADVLHSAIQALGHLDRPGCVGVVAPFAAHPEPSVREAVTFTLGGCDDPHAIAVLIDLTADAHTRVRDWATFALGSQSDCDSPQLRTALRARLTDSDGETRGEALKGLARRRDAGAVEAVIAELCGPDPHEYAVEAADELADPRLVPALEALRGRGFTGEWLEGVIERCRGV